MSLLLIGIAGTVISAVMLRSAVFNRASAVFGMIAGGLDLAYCVLYAFAPAIGASLLAMCFIPAAGLFWMLWHILVGLRLIKLSRLE